MAWFFGITVDDTTRRHFVSRLCRAIELAGLTEQQACAYMLLTQAQWGQQKAGIGHLSFTRMMLLPRDVWQWLAVLTAQDDGIPPVVYAAAKLAGASRQMRMALPEAQKEQAS